MYEPIEIQGSKMFLHKDPNKHPLQKHTWEHWEPGTTRLVKAGDVLGIELLDHVILGDGGEFESLRDLGVM